MSITGQTSHEFDASIAPEPRSREHREPLHEQLRRMALGMAWAMKPPRTADVPHVLNLLARHQLGLGLKKGELPDPDCLYGSGIAAIAGDLDAELLVQAYGQGMYPFCHVGPPKWWSPENRMVLFLEDFQMEKNLRRKLRNQHFDITFDRDFEAVIRGCAKSRPGRLPLTWITPQFIDAYCALHEAGHAHSVEVWDKDGELAGGVYGVSVGGAFFTESQFNLKRDAAKVGFAVLNCHLQQWGYVINDGKHFTRHLELVGMKLLPRAQFKAVLADVTKRPGNRGLWCVDPTLDVGNWKPAEGCAPRR